MESTNFWGHKRKMLETWYEGTTGIPPLDDAIKGANEYGYTHHINRLMILSNVMNINTLEHYTIYNDKNYVVWNFNEQVKCHVQNQSPVRPSTRDVSLSHN